MIPLLASTESDAAALGAFGIASVLGFLALFVGIVWLIFPFIVHSKFNTLIREQRETNRLLGQQIAADAASAEASRTVRGPSTAVGMTEGKRPPLPPPLLPKTEPDVYKL